MKRVCFVAYDMSVVGGVEQVTASLANAFCEEYEVFIYSINLNHGEIKYEFQPSIKFENHLQSEGRLRNMITKTFRPFIDFVRENKIDVVLMMENYAALVVSCTRFFTRAKYVYCDHGALMNQWNRKDIVAIKFWDSLIAHKVVVLTERTRNDFVEKFHINPKKIRYIYNWIKPEILEMRNEYNCNSKKIISAGRFGREKGYDLLVQVAQKVMPQNPDWTWELFGDGETFDEVQRSIKECGLESQVILKGTKSNVSSIFGEYAFIVLPSYREGLPLVLLEAKATGIPMVSFDIITGPREIIRDGKDGYLIAPYDTDAMAEKMQQLMADQELRKVMAEETRVNLEQFSKEKIMQEWGNLIENI